MNCVQREQLLERYAATLEDFNRFSDAWREVVESPVSGEYRECLKAREEARLEVMLAYSELGDHMRRHGCRALSNERGTPELVSAPVLTVL